MLKAKAIDKSLVPFGFRAEFTNTRCIRIAGNLNLRPVSYVTSQVLEEFI
jgi:hypothetical protein